MKLHDCDSVRGEGGREREGREGEEGEGGEGVRCSMDCYVLLLLALMSHNDHGAVGGR